MTVVDWFRSHWGPRGGSVGVDVTAHRAWMVAIGSLVVVSLGAAQAAWADLPNNRAYEMVSPPDKNGQDVIPLTFGFGEVEQGSSTSGNAIVYASLSAFPGTPANTLSPQYLSVRGPSSWSTSGLAVPVSPNLQPHGPGVLQMSEDHSKAVVRSNSVLAPGGWGSQATLNFGIALYLRDRSDDSYELLTPEPVPGGSGGFLGPTPYPSLFLGASSDLDHVLFETIAELTDDAVPLEDFSPKLYKWSNGALTLESVLPDGTPVTGSAGHPFDSSGLVENEISNDGSRVFFTARGGADDGRLFVREDGATTAISSGSPAPNDTAFFRGATPDGDHVFFTEGSNLSGRLFRYDVETGTTTLLSVDEEPDDGTATIPDSAEGVLGFSDDGSRVYFAALSQLVDGAGPGGSTNLYLWENGEVKFITGTGTGTPSTVWAPDFGAIEERHVGRDGAGLLLRSSDPFTGYDNSNPDCNGGLCEEIFLYDAGDSEPTSPDLVCVSCDPSGAPPTGAARPFRNGRHLSDGANRAYFDSPDALVPQDSNGRDDVYMWENGELHLISTGRSATQSVFMDASPSGNDLFFLTRERLVGWDQDDARDIYDARVGGGLPEPPSPPVPCSGDPCQGPPSGRPALADAGSASVRGHGDRNPGARPRFRVRRPSKAQLSKLARGRRIVLRVRVNRAGKVLVAARARMGERARVVARRSKRARRAGTVGVPLRLSQVARGALAREGRLSLKVSVRFSGVREAKTLTLNLRRAAVGAGGKGR